MADNSLASKQRRQVHDITFREIVIRDQVADVRTGIGECVVVKYEGISLASPVQNVAARTSVQQFSARIAEKHIVPGSTEDRRFVRPGQHHLDILAHRPAIAVIYGHRIDLGNSLACCQMLDIGVRDIESPLHPACAATARFRGESSRERAEIASRRRRK